MGILQWAAAIDTAGTLARAVKRMGKGALDSLADQPAGDAGTVAQIQARLAGVAVAAIKEVFDRDSARLEMERAQLEAERQRAEELLRIELRRQAAERMLGQLRLIAIMALAIWTVSAVLGVWMPGMREGLWPRLLLGAGWVFVLGALGYAFVGWQYLSLNASDSSASAAALEHPATVYAPWLLVVALALTGAGLLTAL
jgi:hypothetical protein